MKRYIEHMKRKTPHERRQHALQVACVATFLVAVIWLTTLGLHSAPSAGTVTAAGDQTQLANVASGMQTSDTASNAGIEVATTSVFDSGQQ